MQKKYKKYTNGGAKDYAASADDTRYLRFKVGGNWTQMDAISHAAGGRSGFVKPPPAFPAFKGGGAFSCI